MADKMTFRIVSVWIVATMLGAAVEGRFKSRHFRILDLLQKRAGRTLPTTSPPTTTPYLTTTDGGCYYNGKYYSPGEEITRGEDKDSNWCYGSYCSVSGQIQYWDNFNCHTTTPTTTPPTTTPPIGCHYNGQFYPPWSVIMTNWCGDTVCSPHGYIIYAECTTTTPFPTTADGRCYYNGRYYSPGQEITRGEDKNSNWCYGTTCSVSGQILSWDNFNCHTTPPTTIPPTTTV